jgi:alkylhydroperoxidase/carboxymuconolactone decarboxylase family protein YurZ
MVIPPQPGDTERPVPALSRDRSGDSWCRSRRTIREIREPLRGQLRIALNNGVTKDEIVDLFIHLEAYAGAARAFDSYQIALEIFAETTGTRTT